MINLERLKSLIDENNFPYFDDTYLQMRIDEAGEPPDLYALAKELCIIKAGIEEMKLGGHHNTKPQHSAPSGWKPTEEPSLYIIIVNSYGAALQHLLPSCINKDQATFPSTPASCGKSLYSSIKTPGQIVTDSDFARLCLE